MFHETRPADVHLGRWSPLRLSDHLRVGGFRQIHRIGKTLLSYFAMMTSLEMQKALLLTAVVVNV